MRKALLLFIVLLSSHLGAQNLSQTIRGKVIDKASEQALIGVNVVLLGSNPLKGTVTDVNGEFRLENVLIGRQSLQFSMLGYENQLMSNIELNSSKELVLRVEMQEKFIKTREVVITAEQDKRDPINKMSTVSARTFSVEESQKYAGSLNDVARMAQNFAGVQGSNDNRNDLIIRGNSSMGVLYRLEGVDIPNPNHFALLGSSGGPISILNNNTLANSDFFTGAFPAEYGNAIAGVFDLNMRSGNNQTMEFTGQLGFNGAELLAEGPFSKKSRASYLISYRYSTLDLFKLMGISFGTLAVPEYQDISFKFNFPHKKGSTSIFGIAGVSDISFLASERAEDESFFDDEGENLHYGSRLGVVGLNHKRLIGKKSYLRLSVSTQISDFSIINDSVAPVGEPVNIYRNQNAQGRISSNFLYNWKIDSRNLIRAGLYADRLFFDLDERVLARRINQYIYLQDYDGFTYLFQPYLQWKFRLSEGLDLNAGLHYQYLTFNESQAVEPRLGLKWQMNDRTSIGLGFGRHSLMPPGRIYFRKVPLGNGQFSNPNTDIGFLRSDHYVISIDRNIGKNMRFKSELYYQQLSNIPVDSNISNYSLLNQGAGFTFGFPDTMSSQGSGRNYGIEFTLERFLANGFYFLSTLSLYESKFTASDGKEYNTAFNGNFASNLLLGKEFEFKLKEGEEARNVFSANVRLVWTGGQRYIPVDLEASRSLGFQVFDNSRAYEQRYPDYFRFDLRMSWKRDSKKVAQEIAVELQNLSFRNNVFFEEYNVSRMEMVTRYQLGFLPVAQYRIYF